MIKRPYPKIYMAITGIVALAGLGAIYFGWGEVSEESSRVESLSHDAQDLKTVQKQLDDEVAKLQECKAQLTHLELGVPDHAYIPTMLAELERVGKENGIKVTGVKPVYKPQAPKKEGDAKKPYDEVNIEVKGIGKYTDVRKFVSAMNTFPKIIAARTIGLTPKTGTGQEWSDILDVTVEIRGFVFPAGKDARLTTNVMSTEVPKKETPFAGDTNAPKGEEAPKVGLKPVGAATKVKEASHGR